MEYALNRNRLRQLGSMADAANRGPFGCFAVGQNRIADGWLGPIFPSNPGGIYCRVFSVAL
jgi:hypothetical protein